MSLMEQYGLEATITITEPSSGDMFRYDGGPWIEYCRSDIHSNWEPMIYVWDDDTDQSIINLDVNEVAIVIISFLTQEDDE